MLLANKARKKFNFVRCDRGLLMRAQTYHVVFKHDERRFLEGSIMSFDPFQFTTSTAWRTGNIPIWQFNAKELIP